MLLAAVVVLVAGFATAAVAYGIIDLLRRTP